MSKRKDLTGQRFGRLLVTSCNEEVSRIKGRLCWNCVCDCGTERIVGGQDLKSGKTKSCGCLKKEFMSDKMKEQIHDWWQDEEFRQMQSDKTKKQWQDEEFKKIRENSARKQMKERWEDKNWRDMQSELNSNKMKQLWSDEEFRQAHSGENSYLYNFNLTEEDRQRAKEGRFNDSDFVTWSKQVKEKANYTCDCCGNNKSKMHSHHLNNWNTYKEQRYELENGVCLCESCHKEFHKWMGGYKIECTKEQYIEFKNNKKKGGIN